MGDKSVEVLVGGLRDVQVSLADVVNSFIVDHELELAQFEGRVYRAIGVF